MPSYGYRLRVVCLSLSPSSETSPPTASPLVQGYATKTKALAREIPPATRAVLSETRIKLREKNAPARSWEWEAHEQSVSQRVSSPNALPKYTSQWPKSTFYRQCHLLTTFTWFLNIWLTSLDGIEICRFNSHVYFPACKICNRMKQLSLNNAELTLNRLKNPINSVN